MSSNTSLLTPIMELIYENKERFKSVLDVGSGYGKYGLLSRIYLEENYPNPGTWNYKIDAMDIFSGYQEKLHNLQVYNEIFITDITENTSKYNQYDLILMVEVLEHLKKKDAILFAKALDIQLSLGDII